MTWTPVDLATIAGILDTLSVDAYAPLLPGRMLGHARRAHGA